jgi:electron transfer flavoprotein alpha subunit
MGNSKEILLCGEIAEGKLASITLELLGTGRRLADALGDSLSIVFLGADIGAQVKEAGQYGADKVYVFNAPVFKDYHTEAFSMALKGLVERSNPSMILMGQTSMGRDLAPSLAFRFGTVATLDCIDLSIDPAGKKLLQKKPIYGGNAIAVYETATGYLPVATIRAKTAAPATRDENRSCEVVTLDAGVEPARLRTRYVGKIKEEIAGVKLEDAGIVVCGGRGIGSKEEFAPLYELAKILNGVVGGTRPTVDSGWLPNYCQIGLTGKLISPNLYIGIALSGASQHQAGMSGSKNIVAINKDLEAGIFNIAHYGVVGDYRKILPSFLDKCKELASG